MFGPISLITSILGGIGSTKGAAPADVGKPGAANGVSFSDVLAEISGNAVDNLKAGETQAVSALKGKASVQDVVQAVMTAEETLQTALAVRDKAVAAYQEVSRMSI